MSLTSRESVSTGTIDSTASKTSSGQYGNPFLPLSGATTSSMPSFTARRGNIKFSSARFNPPSRSLRSSKRGRGMSSFGRSTRRTAARPARTKGVFEKVLSGLAEGVQAVKVCVEEMRTKLHGTRSRVNYYMDQEKQVKILERKVRTLEVHRDRIEEMRDEYMLKLKLREGAFNIAQALSNQTSKAAREKLQEARAEQRELLEDLCDIEDELETKLGVFKVHINELIGLGRAGGSGDIIETQLKLSSQKWKAKCRVSRHEQSWQDEDIIFLGKVTDELFVKVVEVKKIQGNVLLGNMKCQTREFFSFFPMTVTFVFPTSTAKLSMDIRWSPTIGEDFLSDLDLATVQCIVGGAQTKSVSRAMGVGSVEKLTLHSSNQDIHRIRIIAEPEGEDLESTGDKVQVKVQNSSKLKKAKRKKKEDSDFVFMDRQSIIESQYDEFYHGDQQQVSPVGGGEEEGPSTSCIRVMELSSSPKKHPGTSHPLQQDSRDSSLGSNNSSGSGQSGGSIPGPHHQRQRSPEVVNLLAMLEAVMAALEEPKELYGELESLESQLSRLEIALKGGQLVKAPSMTLSESLAMDTFEFLGSEDNILVPSRVSLDFPESHLSGHRRSNSAQLPGKMVFHQSSSSTSNSTTTPTSGSQDMGSIDSQGGVGMAMGGVKGKNGVIQCSSGSFSVDRALIQHLIHCESLLVHLHSAGPLKYKLSSSLSKLQDEAEIISELLNIAAEPDSLAQIDQILPELAAVDQLMEFWKYVAKEDLLSVSYEQFAVGLDEKFGLTLWNEFPEMASKVLTELISRILDLEAEDWEVDDGMMVVTIFQFSSYFLSQGSKGISKCLREIAQELSVTEGLETNETEAKRRIASMLPNYGYNKGGFLAAAHLLSDPNTVLKEAGLSYVGNFLQSSPWHVKAVECFVELLEHTDQKVRIGACTALAKLEATSAASQLKYLSRRDFSLVRAAASRALQSMGNIDELENGDETCPSLLDAKSQKHKSVLRTRSAELLLGSES